MLSCIVSLIRVISVDVCSIAWNCSAALLFKTTTFCESTVALDCNFALLWTLSTNICVITSCMRLTVFSILPVACGMAWV
ncbi:hypothetical protein D1872_317000 [compost metagenome]